MKFVAKVEDGNQKYDVHLELPDDETGRARVSEALTEIQQRFLPRTDPKKPAPRTPATPRTTNPSAEAKS